MRNLTDYEQARIKDAIKLSKKYSTKEQRKEIKKLLKKSLTAESSITIYNCLKQVLNAQTAIDLHANDLYDLDYAHCTIIAMRHLTRAVNSMKERPE